MPGRSRRIGADWGDDATVGMFMDVGIVTFWPIVTWVFKSAIWGDVPIVKAPEVDRSERLATKILNFHCTDKKLRVRENRALWAAKECEERSAAEPQRNVAHCSSCAAS